MEFVGCSDLSLHLGPEPLPVVSFFGIFYLGKLDPQRRLSESATNDNLFVAVDAARDHSDDLVGARIAHTGRGALSRAAKSPGSKEIEIVRDVCRVKSVGVEAGKFRFMTEAFKVR